MLNTIGRRAAAVARTSPHTDVVGLARTLLAAATLATLLLNPTGVLFAGSADGAAGPVCSAGRGASAFCLVGPGGLEMLRWATIVVLAVVASGWRPRLTALPHWYVTWSLGAAVTLADGGDQVAASLTLLLVPVALTDPRRWHWGEPPSVALTTGRATSRVVARAFLWLIRLQVAGIYLHAAIAKLGQPEWADGTALYYWLGNPAFGLPPWIRALSDPLLHSGAGVAALTWGVVVLELVLAAGLVVEPRRRAPLLVAGLALHAGIVGMGLMSFATVMFAALLLYLRPVDAQLHLARRLQAATAGGPARRTAPAATIRRTVGAAQARRAEGLVRNPSTPGR